MEMPSSEAAALQAAATAPAAVAALARYGLVGKTALVTGKVNACPSI